MFEWISIWASKPDVGRAIVVVYDDGSGASLFRVLADNGGIILLRSEEHNGEDDELIEWDMLADYGYAMWAYLPADFKLWSDTP